MGKVEEGKYVREAHQIIRAKYSLAEVCKLEWSRAKLPFATIGDALAAQCACNYLVTKAYAWN